MHNISSRTSLVGVVSQKWWCGDFKRSGSVETTPPPTSVVFLLKLSRLAGNVDWTRPRDTWSHDHVLWAFCGQLYTAYWPVHGATAVHCLLASTWCYSCTLPIGQYIVLQLYTAYWPVHGATAVHCLLASTWCYTAVHCLLANTWCYSCTGILCTCKAEHGMGIH